MGTASSRCGVAIPQINWETISESSYWKTGDYDRAVLEEMGLEWIDPNDITKGVKKKD